MELFAVIGWLNWFGTISSHKLLGVGSTGGLLDFETGVWGSVHWLLLCTCMQTECMKFPVHLLVQDFIGIYHHVLNQTNRELYLDKKKTPPERIWVYWSVLRVFFRHKQRAISVHLGTKNWGQVGERGIEGLEYSSCTSQSTLPKQRWECIDRANNRKGIHSSAEVVSHTRLTKRP